MKYVMQLRARPDETTIAEKHQHLVSELTKLDGLFGLWAGEFPAPDCGEELSARFELGKALGKGISGFVSYRFRGRLQDHADYDDLLDLEFNPKKVGYDSLLNTVFPRYIDAFQPYAGFIGDEEFTYVDFDRSRNRNARYEVIRFYPVAFYSNEFCMTALRLTPEELTRRVADVVMTVKSVSGGLLVVGSDSPVDFNRAEEFHVTMQDRLQSGDAVTR